ncbi:hypothetical protein [Mycobacterium sp. Marseille-P9652]|uniref:hypothetical protein n=1 Tax=Mycobacterium sp. Marseille-P9652 TaxID=2654950 RepID=UPI0012E98875|nr:hypothetical protein [Mycobacterium sp. Marseille-P9652]
MSIDGEPGAERQFVASATVYSPIWEKMTGKRATIVIQVVFWAVVIFFVSRMFMRAEGRHPFPAISGRAIAVGMLAGLAVLSVVVCAYLLWRWRLNYPITVTTEGLAIGGRRGVYSLDDAELGIWVDSGVALHLHRGRRRFLLGGRDRRVGPSTPLNAPPVRLVDAWLPEHDFDRLLSMSARWSGPTARAPAPGDPTRCQLFPNSGLIQQMGPFAFLKKQRLMRSLSDIQLFVDVDNDSIRVLDPNTNALNGSAALSHVTARVSTYQLSAGHAFASAETVVGDAVGEYFSAMPTMTLGVAGMQPLSIGCRDFAGVRRRFWWRGDVPVTSDPPAYTVSAADWLTLVERLGLTHYLMESGAER